MLKCSKAAFAACPDRHLCGCPDEAVFAKGSECDEFNRQIRSHTMTHADQIRAMSDEELAKLIVDNHPMHAWNKEVRHIFFDGPRITHKEAWLQWLKQPAEVSDNG